MKHKAIHIPYHLQHIVEEIFKLITEGSLKKMKMSETVSSPVMITGEKGKSLKIALHLRILFDTFMQVRLRMLNKEEL